jgi:hypothetical protein
VEDRSRLDEDEDDAATADVSQGVQS